IPTPNDWGLFYLVVHAEGELSLPRAILDGTFDLIADEFHAVMAMDGHLLMGFEEAEINLLELRAGGAFLLDSTGLAGKLHLSLDVGQSLPFADLFGPGFGFSGDAQFDLIVNLTTYEKDITLPDDFDALGVFSVSESDKKKLQENPGESVLLSDNLTRLQSIFNSTKNKIEYHLIIPDTPAIPVTPPQGNGICYVVFMGSGRVDLGGILHMDGNFMIELSDEKLEFQVDATSTMKYVGSFDLEGILRINTEGLVAHFEVFVDAGFGGSLGLEFSGDALLEINTTADAIQQIGNYTVEQKGLLLEINGQLRISGLLNLEEGYFYFYISELKKDISPDFELELRIIAKGTLLSIGSFDVDGGMRIDIEGLVAHIEVTLSAGFGSGVGLSFSGNLSALLDVNTTGSIKYINQERVDPGLLLRITGDLTMLGLSVDGTFAILIQPGVIKLDIDGSISLLGTTLTVDALGIIYTAYKPGFVLDGSITINGSLFSIPNIFDISADFKLQINTRSIATIGIPPKYFLIDMKNAEVKLLGGVLTFKGSAYIEISGSYFKIVLRTMTLNFFNKGSLTASGFLDSNGNFSLNLYGHIDISINENNGIFGTLSYANISRTNGNLNVSGAASVTARVLGYDIGTVSAVFNYDSTSGRIKTTVTGSKIVIIHRVRVYNVFKRKWVTIIPEVSITPSKTFTIGYLKAPPP
ncbi:hypothetical protein KA005_79540, partial [bacterium]|nr:hypothetical protein [bacterium]